MNNKNHDEKETPKLPFDDSSAKAENLTGEDEDKKKNKEFQWPSNLRKPDVVKIGYPPRFYKYEKPK